MNKIITTWLVIVLALSTNALAKMPREIAKNFATSESKVTQEIVAINEQLAEFSMPSFGGVAADIIATTAIGTFFGAVAGVIEANMSRNRLAVGLAPDHLASILHFLVHAGVQTITGGTAGFWLGVAGCTGEKPQISKKKLTLILALQSVIIGLLFLACDTGVQAVADAPGRRLVGSFLASPAIAAATGTVPLIIEMIAVYSSRGTMEEQKKELEKSLKKLKKALEEDFNDEDDHVDALDAHA